MADYFSREDIGAVPDALGNTNRGYDVKGSANDPSPIAITLERINETLMDYLANTIQPIVDQNGNARRVPVLYATPERWEAIRKEGYLRDVNSNKLQAPVILLRRTAEREDSINNPNNKYVYLSAETGWNKTTAYDRFNALNGIRPTPKVRHIMIPDYMVLTYEIFMWADQQVQVDAMITQLNNEAHEFWGPRNNFKFRVSFSEGFSSDSNLPSDQERVIRTQVSMEVHAYILPERVVQTYRAASSNKTAYGPKKVVIAAEIDGTKLFAALPASFEWIFDGSHEFDGYSYFNP